MINLNKIKPVTNKYGYKFIYIDTSCNFGGQYKFTKDYKHLKLNVYLTFNEFDKVSNYFYLIEVKNTILKENDIDEIINANFYFYLTKVKNPIYKETDIDEIFQAKEMINDDIDNMIKELNYDNI